MITLKTLPNATAQQVFDQVAAHLMAQRQLSSDAYGICQYRHGNLMCAAGCLIGNGEYDESYEKLGSWGSLVAREIAPRDHIFLIQDLQDVHDEYNVREWPSILKRVSVKYDCSARVVVNMEPEFNKAMENQ